MEVHMIPIYLLICFEIRINEIHSCVGKHKYEGICIINFFAVKIHPIVAFEMLFFAVFGQATAENLQQEKQIQQDWTLVLFKIVYGIYMLVSVVVLINLLIAMMSDTYQRIQVSVLNVSGSADLCISRFHNLTFILFYFIGTIRYRMEIRLGETDKKYASNNDNTLTFEFDHYMADVFNSLL